MNLDKHDVEAYAKTSDMGTVVSVLSRAIGALVIDCPADTDPMILKFQDTSVVLGRSEDGFLSVWVRGSHAWATSPALGRYLATALHCTVLCDPGCEFPEVSPYSSVFLQIENGRESLVTLE